MSGANVARGEDADERRSGGSGFDVGAAALLAVDQAEDSYDDHAGLARGFDGGDGGASGGADIIDDDDRRFLFEEAFDFAAGAVGLLGFADEEALEEFRCRVGWVQALFEGAPGAGAGGVGDEGVGSHGEAADGFGLGEVLTDEVVEDQPGEAASLGVERGGAAVDVVVGLLAAGEGEVSEPEGEGGDEVEEGFSLRWHGLLLIVDGTPPSPIFLSQNIHFIDVSSGSPCLIWQKFLVFDGHGLQIPFGKGFISFRKGKTPALTGVWGFTVYFYCSRFGKLVRHAEVIDMEAVMWFWGLTTFEGGWRAGVVA